MADTVTVTPNKGVYATVFVGGLFVFGAIFVAYGLLVLPEGNAQQVATYFGTRLIPIGVAVTLVGFVAAIASAAATALGTATKSGGEGFAPQAAVIGDLTDLLKAAASLSSTPAGIGVLLTLLGAFLLVGSGAASTQTPTT